jgi:hypothetical protein
VPRPLISTVFRVLKRCRKSRMRCEGLRRSSEILKHTPEILKRLCAAGMPHQRDGDRYLIEFPAAEQWLGSHPLKRARATFGGMADPRPGFIYGIVDPRNGRVRYVGKATTRERWQDHLIRLRAGKHDNSHLQRWFRLLDGLEPKFIVLQECLPGMIDTCEMEWIARGRAKGWPLCNQDNGGGLPPATLPHVRKKLARLSRSKWSDPEYRHRWEAATGRRYRGGMLLIHDRLLRGVFRAKLRRARREAASTIVPAMFVPLTCGNAAFVPLTNGKWAVIDRADLNRVSQHQWSASRRPERDGWRVKTNVAVDGRKTIITLQRFLSQTTGMARAPRHRHHSDSGLFDFRRSEAVRG